MRATLITILLLSCWTSGPINAFAQSAQPPKLVLQITVDQLRGDLPFRYRERFTDGGFNYLLENGTVFRDAHHRHANTETIVGHTTLATGADPSMHGMVGNVWLDRTNNQMMYNIEDSRYPILSKDAGVNRETEIDPTQKTARTDGRSPNAIAASTFSDELALHYAGKSKVFGVSVKDRGAVSMAGHTGKAFWFSKQSSQFITSSYYYDEYPEWVTRWNARAPTRMYENQSWSLLNEPSTYMFGNQDDQAWETDLAGFGRTFPHRYGPASGKYFSTFLTVSPAGDQLTYEFALELMKRESIGQDDIPDYLSISFSSTDYVGHVFGPSSLESEDQILRLDRLLEKLFKYVDQTVGLENTVIVLSADHGSPEALGYLQQFGIEADYIVPAKFDKAKAIAALKKRFGIGERLIEAFHHPYLYLNRSVIREKGLDQAEVEDAICEELMKFDGVNLAISSTALTSGDLPSSPIIDSVLRNYQPKRSGDIFLVFDPHRFINDFDGLTVACTHGSPWRYDTFVPIMFAGPGIPAIHVNRQVHTVQVAPTLSRLLNIKPPTSAMSGPLIETFQSEK